jgi:succinate-semialdehyde dehydrogenase/glutarate-semialdehyde dehydrogenase
LNTSTRIQDMITSSDLSGAEREGRLLIDHQWRAATGNGRFDVVDPATGLRVGTAPEATLDDVVHALDAAAAALPAWRAIPAIERSRILQRAAARLRSTKADLAALITAEQGKPLKEAEGEVEYAAGFFDWFAGEAERIYGQIVPSPRAGKRVLVLRQPVGVTAAITPWNFPAAMLTRKLGPALAAGCTSVVKPAEATPLTAIEVCRALVDAGAPPGVVNVVTSTRPAMVADVLFADSRLRKLSFTGSTEVGKELILRSAAHVQRLSLELGGHAPYIVFDDADLEGAVEQVMASKFRNAGQTCICANRIYVQRNLYKEFRDHLTERTSALKVGPGAQPGVDIGPLIDAAAVDKVEQHVGDAASRGARVTTGGTRITTGELARGHFFAPTVLDGVTPDMRLWREETFGPVAPLACFDTEEEVIGLANRHAVRLGGLCAHARLCPDVPSGGAARLWRHRCQRWCAVEPGGSVRRTQGIGLRPRRRRVWHRRVSRCEVSVHCSRPLSRGVF